MLEEKRRMKVTIENTCSTDAGSGSIKDVHAESGGVSVLDHAFLFVVEIEIHWRGSKIHCITPSLVSGLSSSGARMVDSAVLVVL